MYSRGRTGRGRGQETRGRGGDSRGAGRGDDARGAGRGGDARGAGRGGDARGAGRGGRFSDGADRSFQPSRGGHSSVVSQEMPEIAQPPPPIVQHPPPSVAVESVAAKVESISLDSGPHPVSSKAIRPPSRPGFCTLGRTSVVRTNHFIVEVADTELFHYDVTITPETISKGVNRKVISRLVELHKQSYLGNITPAYDGAKSLFTAGAFPFTSKEFVVTLDDNPSSGGFTSKRKPREYNVLIKFANQRDLESLQQFMKSRHLDLPQETIQILDVVLREKPSKDYCVVGRSFFSRTLGTVGELGDGLLYWSGYYQSLRPTQMGLSLNIDVSARSFYEPINVCDYIIKYLKVRGLSKQLSDQDRLKVKKTLKGIRVQVTYSTRRYKITGISNRPTSQLMFSHEDREMSVAQYYAERYSIVLDCPFLPALQAGPDSKPTYLPMELCMILDGQRYTKKLNEIQVTALLRATCQRPNERESRIQQMVKRMNGLNREDFVTKEFGIKVMDGLTTINARVLPPPTLKYHKSGQEAMVDPRVGQWNMINKKVLEGGRIDYWTYVNFSSRMRPDIADQFCRQLIAMCESKGIIFNPMPLIEPSGGDSRKIEQTLLNIHSKCTSELAKLGQNKKHLQLLIILLPDVTGSYGKIKRICETELGIVSQCCQPQKASKLSPQYYENVALKINVKVGGRNNMLAEAFDRKILNVSDLPTIIFGADVNHPSPGEDTSPSIASVVASMDWPEVTKYRGLVSSQTHRDEIIADLYKKIDDPKRGVVHGGMIREHLLAFYKSTGQKPYRIIFYRDGVSEGQFSQVLLYEMDAIRKACVSLQSDYLPPVTFIVVQKRHHTRFFPSDYRNRDQTDRSGNILPGTVVDTNICHPTEFDFYLNSHAGIQGTSRPSHYHVLIDENRFTADALQKLTNSLCYTYARCTRSVSIVPPAYYAHLAAFRARYYIEGDVSDSGSTSAGGGTRDTAATFVRPLPAIKEAVKEVMFFC